MNKLFFPPPRSAFPMALTEIRNAYHVYCFEEQKRTCFRTQYKQQPNSLLLMKSIIDILRSELRSCMIQLQRICSVTL